ncbi:sporulation protein [Candidatus Bathyarchaeota archaeon]|nr:sporulation protein [Candidatus Bathyarchaeota archaeon]
MRSTFDVGTVVGDPIDLGDKKVIPIVKLSFGSGGGGGEGKALEEDESAEGGGGGFAVGGTVEPVALIISYQGVKGKEGFEVIELKGRGGLGELASALAPMMKQFMQGSEKSPEEEKEKEDLMSI